MLAMGVGEPVRRRGYAAGPGAAGSIGRRAGGSRWGVSLDRWGRQPADERILMTAAPRRGMLTGRVGLVPRVAGGRRAQEMAAMPWPSGQRRGARRGC